MEETFLLELLDLQAVDLVNRFQDVIEDKAEYLFSELEQLAVPAEEEEEEVEEILEEDTSGP
jgi:hypothetical protein